MSPAISRDGLSLYFGSDRSGTFAIWVSQRTAAESPWGAAEYTTIDRANQPSLSLDEHRLFFLSGAARSGGFGGLDLHFSRRRDKQDATGWGAAENLGGGINTSANEVGASFFEDDLTRTTIMYFSSNRSGGPGGNDIYASVLLPDGAFSSPVLVAELSSPADDNAPVVRRDGLEMFIESDRFGTLGGADLWVATRARTSDSWSTPVNLGPIVNTSFSDGGPALSLDGTALYFHSNANHRGAQGPCFGDPGPCFYDNYVITRRKIKAPD